MHEDRIKEELETYLREHPFAGGCLDEVDVKVYDDEEGTVEFEATACYSAEIMGYYINLEIMIVGKYNVDSDELFIDDVWMRP